MRHLLASEDLRQLLCAAGGVFGRDHFQLNIVAARQHRTHHRDRLRFIIFDTDQHLARLKDMREDAHPFHNLRGAILHQAIVGGDIGFALGSIDNQRIDFIAGALQLRTSREASSAQPGNAELMDALNQRFNALGAIILPPFARNPAIFAVRFDNDAQFRQGGGVCGSVRGNRHNGAGGRRVHRQHTTAAAGQRLSAQNAIAHADAQFAFSADMLL